MAVRVEGETGMAGPAKNGKKDGKSGEKATAKKVLGEEDRAAEYLVLGEEDRAAEYLMSSIPEQSRRIQWRTGAAWWTGLRRWTCRPGSMKD
jgi:hypothetical protein